jgi:hypothetical protein
MNRRRSTVVLVFLLAAAVIPLACGDSSPSAPAAPATVTPATTSGPAAVSAVWTAVFNLDDLTVEGTAGAGVAAPVIGIVAKISGTCPTLSFVLSGVNVQLSAKTTIEGGTCADIKEGVRAGAMGDRNADGSVQAVRVKIGPPPPTPVTGIVSKLSGACPNVTFELEGVTVRTGSKTVFDSACSSLANGVRAGAIGPKGADGAIDAEHVKIAPAQPPAPPAPPKTPTPPATGTAVSGLVKGLSGTCPSLTFTIETTTVRTGDRTVFDGCVCADVKAGVRAGAIGEKRGDGSIDATRVKVAK